MGRRWAVAAVVLVAGVAGTTAPAVSAAPPKPELSVQPKDVARGGTVILSGQCWVSGNDAWAAVEAYSKGTIPVRNVSRSIPLVDASTFEAQLVVPVDAPPGTYVIGVLCGSADMALGSVTVDPGFTVNQDPPLPAQLMPTLTLPPTATPGSSIQIAGSCPAGSPAPDRVLIETAASSTDPSPRLSFVRAALGPDRRFQLTVPLGGNELRGNRRVTAFCRAGARFLGEATGSYRVEDAPPVTTSSTTTPAAVTTVPDASSAPGARPVVATSRFTG